MTDQKPVSLADQHAAYVARYGHNLATTKKRLKKP